MEPAIDSISSTVKLTKKIDSNIWLAQRIHDSFGEQLIARRIERQSVNSRADNDLDDSNVEMVAHRKLVSDPRMLSGMTQILNHENIVSLVGYIKHERLEAQHVHTEKQHQWAVWEFCDAGNLDFLFSTNPQPEARNQRYLPESLCWHVLRSLLRAVVFLHDGKRRAFDHDGKLRSWVSLDADWNPILHRALEPTNVFFQHPRGRETYGPCKLGHFTDAAMTNHVLDTAEDAATDSHVRTAVTSRKGWQHLETVVSNLARDDSNLPWNEQPYALADEILSIGAIIFQMMTGHILAYSCEKYGYSHVQRCRQDGGCLQNHVDGNDKCKCINGGCSHVLEVECEHPTSSRRLCRRQDCVERTVNVDSSLTRADYSWWLRHQVKRLLDLEGHGVSGHRALTNVVGIADECEYGFRRWREDTAEGRAYRDVDDEVEEGWKKELRRQVKEQDRVARIMSRNE
ncbi:hypothetical protein HJFPF1_09053 [Paramyrothecium foliicola]|nr:hypothetical protein HJFPF1_09053 [Paramyrothecium foliicola]